jgi:hypothetical protein
VIVPLLFRIAAVKALRGATAAEDRVYDSALSAFDFGKGEPRAPFIVVAIGDERGDARGSWRLGALQERRIDLMFDLAVTKPGTLDAGADRPGVVIPPTDDGLEATLDLLHHQLQVRLQTGTDAWSECFRILAGGVHDILIRRGGDAKTGARFAARQIAWTLSPMFEPDKASLATWLQPFVADPELSDLAAVVRAAVEGPETTSTSNAIARLLGLTRAEATAFGLPPAPGREAARVEIDLGDGLITVGPDGQRL